MHALNEYIAGMKQITVRNVPERTIQHARERSSERGVSLNQIFIEALNGGLGLTKEATPNGLEKYSADSDFGPGWEAYLEELKQIDSKDWQ